MKNQLLVKIVRAQQDTQDGPPSIRSLSRRLRMKQSEVLDMCEDESLNVNIGIQCPNGVGLCDRIGDYTIEDLTVAVHPA